MFNLLCFVVCMFYVFDGALCVVCCLGLVVCCLVFGERRRLFVFTCLLFVVCHGFVLLRVACCLCCCCMLCVVRC